jgi:tetratricopeptide (TPR) repeat protein
MNRMNGSSYLSRQLGAEQPADDQLAERLSRQLQAKRRYDAEQNFERGYALIQALFARHSRLNVIRLDLEYLHEHLPSLEQAKDDFNRLLNNSRYNAIFDHVVGVAWRLEWAPDTGWHWHVIYFIDDSKRNQDWYIAQQIGHYWCNVITGGRGRMHNCNADKNQYKRLGIGTISHDDYDKRDVLVNVVLRYLTKVDERLFVPKGTRSFGTSQMPEPHSGLGRPRALCSAEVRSQSASSYQHRLHR